MVSQSRPYWCSTSTICSNYLVGIIMMRCRRPFLYKWRFLITNYLDSPHPRFAQTTLRALLGGISADFQIYKILFFLMVIADEAPLRITETFYHVHVRANGNACR